MNLCNYNIQQINKWMINDLPGIKDSPEIRFWSHETQLMFRVLESAEWESDLNCSIEGEIYFTKKKFEESINNSALSKPLKCRIISSISHSQTSACSAGMFGSIPESIYETKKWMHISINISMLLKELAFQKELLLNEGNFKVLPKEILMQISDLNFKFNQFI